jgi:hypothetical protein
LVPYSAPDRIPLYAAMTGRFPFTPHRAPAVIRFGSEEEEGGGDKKLKGMSSREQRKGGIKRKGRGNRT